MGARALCSVTHGRCLGDWDFHITHALSIRLPSCSATPHTDHPSVFALIERVPGRNDPWGCKVTLPSSAFPPLLGQVGTAQRVIPLCRLLYTGVWQWWFGRSNECPKS